MSHQPSKKAAPETRLKPRELGHLLIEVAHPHIEELSSVSASAVTTKPVGGKSLDLCVLDETSRIKLFDEIADALKYLHSKGWSHGDIRARSIYLSPSKGGVLTGLGFARRIDSPDAPEALHDLVSLASVLGLETRPTEHTSKTMSKPTVSDERSLRMLRRVEASRRSRLPKLGLLVLPVIVILTVGASLQLGSERSAVDSEVAPRAETFSLESAGAQFEIDATSLDKVLTTNFDCGATRTVMLRHRDRTLWTFSDLPSPGEQALARPLTQSLSILDAWVDKSSPCETLMVIYSDGTTQAVKVI